MDCPLCLAQMQSIAELFDPITTTTTEDYWCPNCKTTLTIFINALGIFSQIISIED